MELDSLFEKSLRKLHQIKQSIARSLMDDIDWNQQLIGIKGARGVGKTTLMLQRLNQLNLPPEKALYASCDNIWFSSNNLVGLAETFAKRGGKTLFLDEVHKYPNWAQELKNIYDDLPELRVVFTGSSLLEILNARADLSRRAIIYTMQGLSFREYLTLETGAQIQPVNFDDLPSNHASIAAGIAEQVKPLEFFHNYLKYGYFPFYRESIQLYGSRLDEVISMMLHIELPLLRNLDASYIYKIKQLLQIISESAPFAPNVSKLSERIGINRNTLISYLYYLHEAGLTRNLYKDIHGISRLQKPDKIYLDNPNLYYTLNFQQPNIGHVRECFFLNQVDYRQQTEYIADGDFIVNRKWIFELGGKSKSARQLKNTNNGYIVSDDLEIGYGNRIPLWLFGFLY